MSDIPLNLWKTKKICTERFQKSEYIIKTTPTCPATHPKECGCYCFQGTLCPISEWGLYADITKPPNTKTTWEKGNNWIYKSVKKTFQFRRVNDASVNKVTSPHLIEPFALLPQIEIYGRSCISPEKHPKDPSTSYILYSVLYKGCGIFEYDPYSIIADDHKQWDFYEDNKALMGVRLQL